MARITKNATDCASGSALTAGMRVARHCPCRTSGGRDGKERGGHKAIFWELNGHRAARKGDWKIVAVPKGPWELYDLSTDPGETKDLAKAHPEELEGLIALYTAWSARCNEGR